MEKGKGEFLTFICDSSNVIGCEFSLFTLFSFAKEIRDAPKY